MIDNISLDMANETIEMIDYKSIIEFYGNIKLENIHYLNLKIKNYRFSISI